MDDTEYDYEHEDERDYNTRSNTSFSNVDNPWPGSPFNEFRGFQNNPQILQSRSRLASSVEGDQPDIEYYPDEENIHENEGEDYYEDAPQNTQYVGTDDYENILMAMRQRVKQMKNKLKPENPSAQYNSLPVSARSSKSNLIKGNMSSQMMQISRIEKQDAKNQHWMSGFLKSSHSEVSYLSARAPEAARSSSVNPIKQPQFQIVHDQINEEADIEELMSKIEILSKENKSLKEANRYPDPNSFIDATCPTTCNCSC